MTIADGRAIPCKGGKVESGSESVLEGFLNEGTIEAAGTAENDGARRWNPT